MGRKQEKCKEGFVWALSNIIAAAFEYDTAKIVHIKNKKVGLMNRLVQLAIIGYVIGYGIIYDRGYQKTGSVVSTVTTKMKGAYLFDNSEDFMIGCEDYFNLSNGSWSVYDPADYVIPPQEPNSFFVMTNMWITCGQQYGICPESPSVLPAHCVNDSDCEEGHIPEGGNGPFTGECDDMTNTCKIRAWCPVEEENQNITHSEPRIDASNFTVLIKNSIRYPSLRPDDRKRNIKSTSNATFLKTCRFNPHNHDSLYCPIMSLGYIISRIHGENFTKISTTGGVIGIGISWNCNNLEYGLDHCDPEYTFRRLDDKKVKISEGYNFRFARYYERNGTETRTLFKAYGILFKVMVTGQGGKFDFFVLVLKLGSMIALLGIAVVISDVIVLYILKKGKFYREKKYLNVNDSEGEGDYEIINNPDDEGLNEGSTQAIPVPQQITTYASNSASPPLESDKF